MSTAGRKARYRGTAFQRKQLERMLRHWKLDEEHVEDRPHRDESFQITCNVSREVRDAYRRLADNAGLKSPSQYLRLVALGHLARGFVPHAETPCHLDDPLPAEALR